MWQSESRHETLVIRSMVNNQISGKSKEDQRSEYFSNTNAQWGYRESFIHGEFFKLKHPCKRL